MRQRHPVPFVVLFWLVLAALAPLGNGQGRDTDSDGDGLSDFRELHKYFTDPTRPDSDGDGVHDGDWDERREFSYTVRSVVRVLPPVTSDVLCDDYQDARLRRESAEYVELEVVHYPLNTVAEAIEANAEWRDELTQVAEYLRPGPTSNWDAEMRTALIAALASDGIDVAELDDRQTVEQVSRWLLNHAKHEDLFTTFCSHVDDNGDVRIYPGLEEVVERSAEQEGYSVEDAWQRELFAKSMFENGTRGSCTSSAIYLNGCLRAVGVPTRIVLTVPIIDASDPEERALLRNLEHNEVRRIVRKGISGLGKSWASHTYNEVWVGGRWRRLNYNRLGQNILDEQYFGLMTHVATFHDWLDGELASTWGLRQELHRFADDAFGGANPYSTLELADEFGEHCALDNPEVDDAEELTVLTIERAYWYHSAERHPEVSMRLDDPETAGHVLVHVAEGDSRHKSRQYATFYDLVGKEFTLSAAGHEDVPLRAARGYWVNVPKGVKEFYLRIEPDDLQRMVEGVSYELAAQGGHDTYQWKVADGVTLVRDDDALLDAPAPLLRQTVERLEWSDSPGLSPWVREQLAERPLCLLLRPAEWQGFPALKRFTANVDNVLYLEREGAAPIELRHGVGGYSSSDGMRWVIVSFASPAEREKLTAGEYELRARNGKEPYEWVVPPGFGVRR